MKIIVAGGRDFTNIAYMDVCIKDLVIDGSIPDDSELVCGMARGADSTARTLWITHYNLPVHEFPADWDTHGKAAGYIRNTDMGNEADVLIAFWDGVSRGTQHMINYMRSLDKPVYIFRY